MAATGICAVQNCGKKREKRDWCGAHYRRWRLYGDPLALRGHPNGTCLRWLKDHLEHVGDECLIWPFSRKIDSGYAQMTHKGRNVGAHRVMCELRHGPPPIESPEAAHSCGRGHDGCVHPGHLRWSTRSENMLDKREHGTVNLGEKTSCVVLTADQVQQIVALSPAVSERSLASRFGVHRSTINCILTGRSWGWLTGRSGGHKWLVTAPTNASPTS